MNKSILQVPKGIRKLSEWTDFLNHIPSGRVIINKRLTGCGATTLFLKNQIPLILCAHRSELLSCKAESDLHKNEVHLFKDAGDMGKTALNENMSRLYNYVNQFNLCSFFNPIGQCPKILVTADSLHHVIDVLERMNVLQYFSAVSDEMQCIFTDAAFKGDVVLNYLQSLGKINNVILLSATPYLETYLDEIPEFNNLPYIELDWESLEPGRVVKPCIHTKKVKSLKSELDNIIEYYKRFGYFEEKIVCGEHHYAKQGVFYLNSVDLIVSAIKKHKLTPNECNVICSRTNAENSKKLAKVGFSVGSAQKLGEEHKPYTFITRCAFEGVDLYHPSGFSYVFADPNIDNLALDISIDIDQIMGRLRLDSNVFKYNAIVFFKTTNEENLESKEDFDSYIQSKVDLTKSEIQSYKNLQGRAKTNKIGQVNSAHKQSGFKYDYLTFCKNEFTNEWEPKENFLVKTSERRAWDIRNHSFADEILVLQEETNKRGEYSLSVLFDLFDSTGDFRERMMAYCGFLDVFPDAQDELEQKSVGVIDCEFHQFYRTLGPEIIKANLYQRSMLVSQMKCVMAVDKIESSIRASFHVGDVISCEEAKKKIQEIYDDLGLQMTAKATDLGDYFGLERTRPKGVNSFRLKLK